jgi:CARDB
MQACRGLVTAIVTCTVALANSSVFAQTGPIVPVPYWMFYPDLYVESITATMVKCTTAGAKTVKFAVTIRNGGYKRATMPGWPYGPWGRIETIQTWNPTSADMLYVYALDAGKTKTFESNMSVYPNSTVFGAFSVGVKVTVDPQKLVNELNEFNNYTEKWFWFPAC